MEKYWTVDCVVVQEVKKTVRLNVVAKTSAQAHEKALVALGDYPKAVQGTDIDKMLTLSQEFGEPKSITVGKFKTTPSSPPKKVA